MKNFLFFLLIGLSFFTSQKALGAMSSTNYYIYADAISVGGILSTSTNYSLQDTLGEAAIGTSTIGDYEIRGGYQFMDRGELSLMISDASLSLGYLWDTNSSSTTSTNVIVSTDSDSGFSLMIGNVSGSFLDAVSDGVVDGVLGAENHAEEYGLGVSGAEAAFADDRAVAAGLVLASAVTAVANSETTLTFKAIKNWLTIPGVYSQNITLIVSANF